MLLWILVSTCCFVVSIVTAIRFSNDDKTSLACSSQDGNLSVFNLSSDPPSISCTLKGHTQPVNGKGNITAFSDIVYFMVGLPPLCQGPNSILQQNLVCYETNTLIEQSLMKNHPHVMYCLVLLLFLTRF